MPLLHEKLVYHNSLRERRPTTGSTSAMLDHVGKDGTSRTAYFPRHVVRTFAQRKECFAHNGELQLTSSPTGDVTRLTDTVAVPTNQWVFAAMTYDGSFIRLFLNGAQVKAGAASGQINVNSINLLIGASEGVEFFTGKIDDIRIYKRVLSDSEIQALYHEAGW